MADKHQWVRLRPGVRVPNTPVGSYGCVSQARSTRRMAVVLWIPALQYLWPLIAPQHAVGAARAFERWRYLDMVDISDVPPEPLAWAARLTIMGYDIWR